MSTTNITPAAAYELAITLCDALNPGHGYQMRLTLGGADVFFGAKDPATGADLLTYADALRVASYYGPPPASMAPLSLATVEPLARAANSATHAARDALDAANIAVLRAERAVQLATAASAHLQSLAAAAYAAEQVAKAARR